MCSQINKVTERRQEEGLQVYLLGVMGKGGSWKKALRILELAWRFPGDRVLDAQPDEHKTSSGAK